MKVTKFRLIIAFLTFGIGVLTVYFLVGKSYVSVKPITKSTTPLVKVVISPNSSPETNPLETKSAVTVYKYKHPAITDGLYYGDDEFELVLSFNNQPIPPKDNEPDAPTIPGFYLDYNQKLDFERVEVIRHKVYFKTYAVNNISYEFGGKTGKEFDRELDCYVPFIKGTIIKLKDGKEVSKSKIIFGHAVIY